MKFKKIRSVALVLLLVCSVAATSLAQDKQKKKKKKPANQGPPALKALLVTGGCCHDYKNQTQILTEGISQRAKVDWEVVLGFSGPKDHKLKIYQTEDWAAGYDVIVHNECYGGVEDIEFVERIVKGHTKHNVPLVTIHCSMHSYRSAKTDQWRELLGVTTVRHEKKALTGLDVVNRASEHPIMKDFGATWRTPLGELYMIEKSWPNMKPLATAYGVNTKKDHPCIWVNEYKGCRVFGTTLGHDNKTMLCDEYLDTVSKGLLWATDKLTEEGKPMKGYEGKGVEPILLPSMMRNMVPGLAPTPAAKPGAGQTTNNKAAKKGSN